MSTNEPDPLLEPVEDIEANEASPLLRKSEKVVTPLPKFQLFIICMIRVVEPVCFASVIPYLQNQIVRFISSVNHPR